MGIFRRFLIRQTPLDQGNNSEIKIGGMGQKNFWGQKGFFSENLDYGV
jgi:hypothetical protein